MTPFDERPLLDGTLTLNGDFYAGSDIGRKADHSVVAVVEKTADGVILLVHWKRFKLGTEYASVIGHLHLLKKRLQNVQVIEIDQTGVGDMFAEEAVKSGLKNACGTVISPPTRQEMPILVKKRMQGRRSPDSL